MDISELSKQVTAYKKAGNFELAIRLQKQVEGLMDQSKDGEFRVESFCRLPMLMHESGQAEEALKQFKEVLKRYPYAWGKLKRNTVGNLYTYLGSERSYIYDKIRLVLQREKRFLEAIPFSVLSCTYVDRCQLEFFTLLSPAWRGKRKPKEGWRDWMDYKDVQEFLKEPLDSRAEYAIQSIEKLLKKADKLDVFESLKIYIYQLIQDTTKSDDTISLEVRLLLRGFPPSP